MLNLYIKHGTFLMEFDDRIKTIQGYWFPSIMNKTIKINKMVFKNHTIDVKRWCHKSNPFHFGHMGKVGSCVSVEVPIALVELGVKLKHPLF
jgi:hypothetical protein